MTKNTIQEVKEAQDDTKTGVENLNSGWIVAGYLLSLIGGIFGFVFGFILYTSKKTAGNGNRMYRYTDADRKHAAVIMGLGLIVTVVYSVLALFTHVLF